MRGTPGLVRHSGHAIKILYRNAVRASFWRGGTSKGLMLEGPNLPIWRDLTAEQKVDFKHCENVLQPFFAAAFGSPDRYGRQLNGMGGGVSSLSKAVIVERSNLDDVDLDYYFVQIGIKDGLLDMAGNCGNLTAAVAPFAVDSGLLSVKDLNIPPSTAVNGKHNPNRAGVILRNMNTGKRIHADIALAGDGEDNINFQPRGDYELDGVSGTASPISLSFLSPAGAKTGKAFPTGRKIDTLKVDGREVHATLSDISNPGIFVDGRQIPWDPKRPPDELTADTTLMAFLEQLRRTGTSMMGLDPDVPSVPKIVLLYPTTGAEENTKVDIRCQALSMQQAHKASPVTLALNLGVTCKIPGTLPHSLATRRDSDIVRIAHPTGQLEVGADFKNGDIYGAKLIRTARWLMDGVVNGV